MKKSTWRYADPGAKALLGSDPMEHFKDPVPVKINELREVWKAGAFFFKIDKRSGHHFHREFSRARELERRGVPVVKHLACGSCRYGNCLITQALEESVPLEDYIAGKVPDDRFLYTLIDFLKLLEYRRIRHNDLHCGNILYVENSNSFYLVDVRDAVPLRWYGLIRFSPAPTRRLLVELMENMSSEKLFELLRRMGVKDPENFVENTLEAKARLLQRQWERRREQILSGYPKFTRLEDGLLVVRKTALAELEQAQIISADAGVFAASFYLDMARIPHRRVLAWSEEKQQLYVEHLPDDEADSATVAQLRSRALKFGIVSSSRDWVCDSSGLVKLSIWKGM